MFSSLPIFKRRPGGRPPKAPIAQPAASRLQAFAVEPRMLFDGAAVATAEVVDHSHSAAAAEPAHAPAVAQADSRPIEARIAHAVEFKDSGGGGTADSPAQADEKWINTADQVKDGNVFNGEAGGHYAASHVVGVQAGTTDQGVHGGVDRTVSGRYGDLTLYADGWYCYEVNDAGRALPPGERAQDSFSYSIANDGGTSTSTITVHLIGVTQDAGGNHDPVAAGNDRSTDQHAAITDGQVIQADGHGNPASSDVDGGALEVTGVVAGQAGQVDRTGLNQPVQGQYGQLTLQADGHYSYTPTADLGLAAGQQVTDRFSYLLCDNQGGEAVGTIVITVTGAGGGHSGGGDHGPCAIDAQPDEYWINNGDTITDGQAIRGDRDPATPWHHDSGDTGQNLHVVGVEAGHAPAGVSGHVGAPITGSFGTLTLNADGSYSYQVGPAGHDLAGGQRAQDVFTYTVADDCGGLATTTITVHLIGLNHNPTPVDHVRPIECDQTITDGQVLQADGHGNGADWDRDGDRLEIQGVVAGKPGEVPREHVGETVHGQYGDLVMNADGSYTYVPHAGLNVPEGQTLTDTFSYRLCDNKGGEAIGTVTITLTCCPDKPPGPNPNPPEPNPPGPNPNPPEPNPPGPNPNPPEPNPPGPNPNPPEPNPPGPNPNPPEPNPPGPNPNPPEPNPPGPNPNPPEPNPPGPNPNPGGGGGENPNPGPNPGGGGSGPQVPPVPGGFDRPVTAPVVAPAPSYSGGVGSTPILMAPLVVAPEVVEPFRFQRVAGVSEEAPAALAPALLAAANKAVKPQDDCIPAVKPVVKAAAKPKPKVVASSVFAKPDVVDKKVPKTFSEQVKGAAKRMPVRHKATPSRAPVDKGC